MKRKFEFETGIRRMTTILSNDSTHRLGNPRASKGYPFIAMRQDSVQGGAGTLGSSSTGVIFKTSARQALENLLSERALDAMPTVSQPKAGAEASRYQDVVSDHLVDGEQGIIRAYRDF